MVQNNNDDIDTLIAISCDAHGLAVVETSFVSHTRRVLYSEHFPQITSFAKARAKLSELVKARGWQQTRCTVVLMPSQYTLLQIDGLPVPDEELLDAVGWKVKDLLPWRRDQTTIDVFKMPPHGPGLQRRRLFVVASETKACLELSSLIEDVGLDLVAIDIYELAVRNLLTLSAHDKNGVACLIVYEGTCSLLMFKKGELYFSRNSDFVEESQMPGFDLAERVALAVTRGFDYYLSQIDQQVPQALAVIQLSSYDNLVSSLNQQLGLDVCAFDINEAFTSSALDSTLYSAAGGVLRFEEEAL